MQLNANLRNCCDVVHQRLSSACTSHGFDCSKVSFATLRHTPAERKNSKSAEPFCLALIFNKKYETERKKKRGRRRRRRERTKVGRKMNSVVRIVEGPARVGLQRDTSKTCPYNQKNSNSQNSYIRGQDDGNVEGGGLP